MFQDALDVNTTGVWLDHKSLCFIANTLRSVTAAAATKVAGLSTDAQIRPLRRLTQAVWFAGQTETPDLPGAISSKASRKCRTLYRDDTRVYRFLELA
jgi:hypothetical protein